MIPRLQIGGIVLQPSRDWWIVGKVREGEDGEEIVEPSFAGRASVALPYFLGRVEHQLEDLGASSHERALLDALTRTLTGLEDQP